MARLETLYRLNLKPRKVCRNSVTSSLKTAVNKPIHHLMSSVKFVLSLLIASAPVTTARTFETLPSKPTSSLRLPTSIVKDSIEFDCAETNKISIPRNWNYSHRREKLPGTCPSRMQYQQSWSFPQWKRMRSQRIRLPVQGANQFQMVAGKKTMILKIFRY